MSWQPVVYAKASIAAALGAVPSSPRGTASVPAAGTQMDLDLWIWRRNMGLNNGIVADVLQIAVEMPTFTEFSIEKRRKNGGMPLKNGYFVFTNGHLFCNSG